MRSLLLLPAVAIALASPGVDSGYGNNCTNNGVGNQKTDVCIPKTRKEDSGHEGSGSEDSGNESPISYGDCNITKTRYDDSINRAQRLQIKCATAQNLTISTDSFVFCDGTKNRILYFQTPGQTQNLQITAIPSSSGQSSGIAPYSFNLNGKYGKKNFDVKRKVRAKATCSSTGDP